MLLYPVYLLISIAVSVLLTWLVRNLANRYDLAFAPVSGRHIHSRPIPRLGGVAVFSTFVLGLGIYLLAGQCGAAQPEMCRNLSKILLISVPVFAIGIWDDLKGTRPRNKLLVQIFAGVCLYFSGLRFVSMEWHFAGPLLSSAICLGATVLWVVLICNAINLIDGLDGLAAGAALFSMVTIFTVAVVAGRVGVTLGSTILAGAMLGFLVFNVNPASIFLGDCGSLFVGFMLSSFVLAEAPQRPDAVNSILVPVISFALPLTDTLLSVLRRFLSGHALFGADREHIHHKMLELGLTQRQVMFVLYGASALCALLSIFLLYGSRIVLIPVMATLVLFVFFGVRRLGYHEFAEFRRVWRRAGWQKEAFARNVAVRKTSAQLLKVRNIDRLMSCLAGGLMDDFDGLEIILDHEFAARAQDVPSDPDALRVFWNGQSREKIMFMLELSTPSSGVIGQLSLYRRIGGELLVDTGLLAGDLRRSLAMALENCFSPTAPAFVVSHSRESSLAEASVGGD